MSRCAIAIEVIVDRTSAGVLQAWPERSGQFADKMNEMPKLVASITLNELDWNNSTVLEGDVVDAVSKLKQSDGGPILVAGSCALVHTLLEHDLVDELRLMVFPVALGSGLRLFPETQRKTVLALADTKAFDTGVVVQTYHPAG